MRKAKGEAEGQEEVGKKVILVSNLQLPARLTSCEREIAMNTFAPITLAAALLFSALHLARADQPGPDWMPAQQVIEQVLKSGYTQVTKIEADDGRWEGEGIKDGKRMEFHADPKTGVITTENLDDEDD